MSPAHHQNQNLNYHHQQQRTGGLQRLTADLAGLQFNDVEALFKTPPPATHKRRSKSVAQNRKQEQEQQQQDQQHQSQTERLAAPDVDPVKDAQETAEDAELLKRFKMIGLVGTGNYARVYKIVTQHGKEVACKAINLSKTSEQYKQKFLPRELTILKTVSHVNIVKTHEIFQYADRVFILMQFCSRGTIADLLFKCGPFSENVARNFFAQIIDAIYYLHNLDYAHRDLKVENILLDQDFVPKLTDFSYSINTSQQSSMNETAANNKHLGKSQQSPGSKADAHNQLHQPRAKLNDTFCGTLPYLSPEMIRLMHYDPKKTDIWSLGVCLYVMLNDRLPFPFNDIKLMIRKQLTRDYKFKGNGEHSDQIKDLVAQMLEPDFSRRVSSHDVYRHPWMMGPREKPVTH